jgi:hypothetical protein
LALSTLQRQLKKASLGQGEAKGSRLVAVELARKNEPQMSFSNFADAELSP